LHALWDNVLYTYRQTIYRPFTYEGWQEIGEISKDLLKNGKSSELIEMIDFTKMSEESHKIALQVYEGIDPGTD
jgi:hypothetical protein